MGNLDASVGQLVLVHYDRTGSTEKTKYAMVVKVTPTQMTLEDGDRYLKSTGRIVGSRGELRPRYITLIDTRRR